MTKIGIIGATGTAGSAIFKEATHRGHEVVAIVRNGAKASEMFGRDISIIESDAFDLTKDQLLGFDVIVNAFATEPARAYLHIDLAAKLVHFFREDKKTRLFFILGAGSLLDENNELYVNTMREMPNSESFIAVPENQLKELEFLRMVDNVNWVGISPGEQFEEGPTKESLLGNNHLLKNEEGESLTTSGTIAYAILDEIENPQFNRDRFTVINK